jgi:phenylalanine-4-hydroxylase
MGNPKRPFKQFTAEDDAVWRMLYQRQWPQVSRYAHSMFFDGLEKLNLSPDRIPNFAEMSERLKELVGWELVSTNVQYSNGQDWFEALARKEFLITEYIRDVASLDYTPLPDIFHDAFGHLPFMANARYANYIHRFALTAIQFPVEKRTGLGSLWWYSIEFGFMKERGQTKAFGAGLMSGYSELERAYAGAIPILPYDLDAITHIAPSPHEFHEKMFMFDSFAQPDQAVDDWVAHAKAAPEPSA